MSPAEQVAHYATHAALKNSPKWLTLPRIGVIPGDDESPAIELRNCSCGSTLGREIHPHEDTP